MTASSFILEQFATLNLLGHITYSEFMSLDQALATHFCNQLVAIRSQSGSQEP